jgi:hypothetical protein
MQLKDIVISSLSITSNQDGSENLRIDVVYGNPGDEKFVKKEVNKSTITVQTVMDALNAIGETAGVGN